MIKVNTMKIEIQDDLFFREKYLKKLRGFYHETELIKVITGVRRCGKSSLMHMIMKELLDSDISEANILYFNLDKRPYYDIRSAKQLDELIEENATAKGKKYLFIDEIQNIKNFESIINAWREEGDMSIFMTDSNSYLLSGELATKLTGRYIKLDMYPLTYEEYLEMKEFLKIPLHSDLDELTSYINDGGFPYSLKLITEDARRQYTENLIEEIFQKDIRERLKIRNRVAFDAIMEYFISNSGACTNLTHIVEDLNNKGVKIKIETASKYIAALEKAKILIRCDRFDIKSRKAMLGDRKYYLSDLSFYYATRTDKRINYGPVLENIVHNYALTHDYNVSVGRFGKFECDFILRSKENDYAYVQVAYRILDSIETEEREYRPLEMISWDNYPRYIMTTDELIQKRNGIRHVNLMSFMKEEKDF